MERQQTPCMRQWTGCLGRQDEDLKSIKFERKPSACDKSGRLWRFWHEGDDVS